MKIVCAQSVLFGRQAFETLGETVVLPDYDIQPHHVHDADALIIRSKTAVTANLLRDSKVQFVGTATAGFDHMDVDFLSMRDIGWCASPGCNANSVSEYVIAALCQVARAAGLRLGDLVMGVIGVGQTGSRVAAKAEALGITVLRNDPPLAFGSDEACFVPLMTLLEECNVITFHVPLTFKGKFATYHLAGSHFFEHSRTGCLLLNSSRGEVVDGEGLLHALEHGVIEHAVLDVWENEPFISKPLLDRVRLGTPHIAGYSFDGRLNGTLTVYREACHFFELEPVWKPDEELMPKAASVTIDARAHDEEEALCLAINAAYDIWADDAALRKVMSEDPTGRARGFDLLRRNYPERREFGAVSVKLLNPTTSLEDKLKGLGFHLA